MAAVDQGSVLHVYFHARPVIVSLFDPCSRTHNRISGETCVSSPGTSSRGDAKSRNKDRGKGHYETSFT